MMGMNVSYFTIILNFKRSCHWIYYFSILSPSLHEIHPDLLTISNRNLLIDCLTDVLVNLLTALHQICRV